MLEPIEHFGEMIASKDGVEGLRDVAAQLVRSFTLPRMFHVKEAGDREAYE